MLIQKLRNSSSIECTRPVVSGIGRPVIAIKGYIHLRIEFLASSAACFSSFLHTCVIYGYIYIYIYLSGSKTHVLRLERTFYKTHVSKTHVLRLL